MALKEKTKIIAYLAFAISLLGMFLMLFLKRTSHLEQFSEIAFYSLVALMVAYVWSS